MEVVRPDEQPSSKFGESFAGGGADVEGTSATQAALDSSVATDEAARTRCVVDRRLSFLTVYVLDMAVKTISILFWYMVFAPFFTKCSE